VDAPCFLCGEPSADPIWTTADRAFAVPGIYTVARCRRCGFLYQKPRVEDARLADCYPDHYPRHQEPSPRIPFKGSPGRIKAARWALSSALGYAQFRDPSAGLLTRLWARRLARTAEWRPVYGALKLFLELTLPLARLAGRGEVIRFGIGSR
jgi:hypothetical protein